jgi:hypothetical protein
MTTLTEQENYRADFLNWLASQWKERLAYLDSASRSCPVSLWAQDRGLGAASAYGEVFPEDPQTPYIWVGNWAARVQTACDRYYINAKHAKGAVPIRELEPLIREVLA